MRLPNGFGSIVYLGINRRRPYAAKTPTKDYTLDGYPIRETIGYYETWDEAYEALAAYKNNPYDIDARKLTFKEVYEMWWKKKYENPNKKLSKSNEGVFKAAYNKSAPLHNLAFREIRTPELQVLMDDLAQKYKYASLEHCKSLWNQMFTLAMEYDIVEKNYASFVQINREDDDEHGVPFTTDEIIQMWACVDTVPDIDMVLVMIYSGFRIKAYETLRIDMDNLTFQGGVKTAAGKNRIVPIHHRIVPLVEKLLKDGRLFGVVTNINRDNFKAALVAAGIELSNHTPHDCRHTLASMLSSSGVPELHIKLILGHSTGTDITNKVYIHKTVDELRESIEKLP